jgi:hypothetical protein
MTSQIENILAHLKNGKSLTSIECLELFGSLRLAARVHDLRELGHNIAMVKIETTSGKRVGRYTLLPPKQGELFN